MVGVFAGNVSLAGSISVGALENASYPSAFSPDGVIHLHQGEFVDQVERVGQVHVVLTDHIAIGSLPDGTGAAAVVLRTTTGGNAAFHELTLMVEGEHGLRWQATTPLGDRVVVEGITMDKGDVVLTLREHAADDPMCCPTHLKSTRFAIRGSRLVASSTR